MTSETSQNETPVRSVGMRRPIPSLTADQILDAIECIGSNQPGRRIMFREFPLEGGRRGQGTPRIDALVMELHETHRVRRIAYEVKTNRRDFERELANPEKRERAMRLADQFFFAVPLGLVQRHEVPDDCGLVSFAAANGSYLVSKVPKECPAPAPDWPVIIDLIRRAFQLGQEDIARRTPLAGWNSVHWLADILANPHAGFFDRDSVLRTLQRELHRHGRKAEGREVAAVIRRLSAAWPDREKDAFDFAAGELGSPG